eukprot:symbB.v1.2.022954.t1/scaffold2070.1/size90664/2
MELLEMAEEYVDSTGLAEHCGRCAKIAWHPVLRHVSSYTGPPWRWNSPSYGFVLKTAVMFFKYWKALIVWTCRQNISVALL